jgi:hypothetical protein
MRRIGLICAAAIVLTGGVVVATDGSREQAARELLDSMRAQEMVRNGARTMTDLMVQSNPKMEPFRNVIEEWANKVLTWDAIAPPLVKVYEEAFTEAEMRTIAAFHKTPEGQKMLDKMPQLMKKQAEIGSELARARQGELPVNARRTCKGTGKDARAEVAAQPPKNFIDRSAKFATGSQ